VRDRALYEIFAAVAIAIAAGLLAIRFLHGVGTRRDLRRHPAPGKFENIEGSLLHYHVVGEGTPTVVFESGLMSTVLSWKEVQPEIAKRTSTFSYDRAGMGWSEAGAQPRDAGRMVRELHTLLDRAGARPPYILVGHSFGGLMTRLFAARYPDEVESVVLIDPVPPSEWHPVGETNRKRIRIGSRILRRASTLARWGVLRFVAVILQSGLKPLAEPLVRLMSKGAPKGDGTTKSPLFWNLPASERDMARVFWVQAKFTETIASQLENLPQSASQVVSEASNLGDIGLTVISAADSSSARLAEHTAIAGTAAAGRHRKAERGGHWVMVDQPQLVLDAIGEAIESARRAHSVAAKA